ncbi:MAG: diacylglycerol kinase family lipid kinase [Bacillota bacterium]|nr:diacylglycerol kinase family lipid kinase [Bacillota bacterium]
MKHVFIINPAAGKRNAAEFIKEEVGRLFPSSGSYSIELTKKPGHAAEIAKKYAETGEPVRIYSCGGDGTLNEVLNGMYRYENAELAVFPSGSGNDFIKMLAGRAAVNLESLVHGVAEKIDIIECEGTAAINCVSAGLDASVANEVSKFKRLPFINGSTAYILSVLRCFLSHIGSKLQFELDGELYPQDTYLFGVAANGRYYGGGFMPAPNADMYDGMLDFVMVKKVSRFRMLTIIDEYKKGTHLHHNNIISLVRCTRARILSDKPIQMNLDGEIRTFHNPEIRVLPSAVSIIKPLIQASVFDESNAVLEGNF